MMHACTVIIVHACIMIIVYLCTVIIAHACTMILVHACTMLILHACTMNVVHVSCATRLMFREIDDVGPPRQSPPSIKGGFRELPAPNKERPDMFSTFVLSRINILYRLVFQIVLTRTVRGFYQLHA